MHNRHYNETVMFGNGTIFQITAKNIKIQCKKYHCCIKTSYY